MGESTEKPQYVLDIELVRDEYRRKPERQHLAHRIHRKLQVLFFSRRRILSRGFWKRAQIEMRRPGGIAHVLSSGMAALRTSLWAAPILDERFITQPPMTEKYGPLVSVVMPVYNQGTILLRAIESVTNQSIESWELIIWDDGSTDVETHHCITHVANFKDPRIRIYREQNRGVVQARNAGLRQAQGTYIVFLDPDDQIQPTYFEKCSLILEGNPSIDICAPWVQLVGHPTQSLWEPETLSWPQITFYNQLPVASMIRLNALRDLGGFREEMSLGWEDWDLWVRLAARGARSTTLRETLFEYTHSEHSGREATSARPNEEQLRSALSESCQQAPPKLSGTLPRTSVKPLLSTTEHRWRRGGKNTVVFFIPWLLKGGGADAFIIDLASGLNAAGFQCIFILTESEIPVNSQDGYELLAEVSQYSYRLNNFLSQQDWTSFIDGLLADLDDPTLICIGSRFFYDYAADRMRLGLWNGRAIDVLFNPIGHLPRHSETQKAFSDVVFAYSALEELAIRSRSISGKSHVIPVGISAKASTKRNLRSRPTIGWLGRFSNEKRPDWFIGTARQIDEPADFLMAGTGPLFESCRAQAKDIGNLQLLGFIESTESFFSEIDLLVITSEIEGISVTAMEALQAGVPVISTNVGGMSDLILDGSNGILVSPDDHTELVSAVRSLIRDLDSLRKLSEYAMSNRLPESFRSEAMHIAYRQLINFSRSPEAGDNE